MTARIILYVLSYFIGNISSSILICRVVAGIDIREHGSGNAGTTNVLRTVGKKAAAGTLIGDVLKGVIAVLLGRYFGGEDVAMYCGILAVIGHIWPVMFKFRGGKGIATGLGAMLALLPGPTLIILLVAVVVIALTRYVSLGSLIGAILLPVVTYFYNDAYLIPMLIMACIAIYTHRSNIKKLISGNESKISFNK
ncbi:MAG: glycerol-3-phosphate 1-O-acyltransferase PlsY [Peptostreptococcales bacterium]